MAKYLISLIVSIAVLLTGCAALEPDPITRPHQTFSALDLEKPGVEGAVPTDWPTGAVVLYCEEQQTTLRCQTHAPADIEDYLIFLAYDRRAAEKLEQAQIAALNNEDQVETYRQTIEELLAQRENLVLLGQISEQQAQYLHQRMEDLRRQAVIDGITIRVLLILSLGAAIL